MKKSIILNSKYDKFKKSVPMLFVYLIISICFVYFGKQQLLLIPLIILYILYVVIIDTNYELTSLDGILYQYNLKYQFYRKTISEFKVEDINCIEIEQDEEKYYVSFLKLNDGNQILLDRYPTKDNLLKRISEIEVELNLKLYKA